MAGEGEGEREGRKERTSSRPNNPNGRVAQFPLSRSLAQSFSESRRQAPNVDPGRRSLYTTSSSLERSRSKLKTLSPSQSQPQSAPLPALTPLSPSLTRSLNSSCFSHPNHHLARTSASCSFEDGLYSSDERHRTPSKAHREHPPQKRSNACRIEA